MQNSYMSGPGEQKVLAPCYDPFFKVVSSPDIADETDGTVECPSGFFAMIDMRECDDAGANQYREVLQAVAAVVDDGLIGHLPEPGIYVTTENDQGLIWAYEFDTRKAAEEFYEPFVAVYSRWCNDEEEVTL